MSAFAGEVILACTWLALGLVMGWFVTWSMMSRRVDARARNLSMTLHEVAKIDPRASADTLEE